MRLHIGESALDEDIRVETDDGVDAGRLVTSENHASEGKGDYIFPAKQGFIFAPTRRLLVGSARSSRLHFRKLNRGLSRIGAITLAPDDRHLR